MKRSLSIAIIIVAATMFIIGALLIGAEEQHAESIYSGATMVMGGQDYE